MFTKTSQNPLQKTKFHLQPWGGGCRESDARHSGNMRVMFLSANILKQTPNFRLDGGEAKGNKLTLLDATHGRLESASRRKKHRSNKPENSVFASCPEVRKAFLRIFHLVPEVSASVMPSFKNYHSS